MPASLTSPETGPTLGVVLPTLNEVGAIGALIAGLKHALGGLCELTICVVDDGSDDGTREVVQRLQQEDPSHVKLIERDRPDGLTGAIREGILSLDTQVVAWLDADGSMPPEALAQMWPYFKSSPHGVVVGSRFAPGGGFKGVSEAGRNLRQIRRNLKQSNDSITAVLLSRIFNMVLRVLLGGTVRDYTSGFILAPKRVVLEVGLVGDYGDYCPVFLYKAQRMGFTIQEVPYINLPRQHGTSKTGSGLRDYVRRGVPYIIGSIKVRFLTS